jgi:hypothetical protein
MCWDSSCQANSQHDKGDNAASTWHELQMEKAHDVAIPIMLTWMSGMTAMVAPFDVTPF